MKQKLCQFLFKLFGWKSNLEVDIPNKCVICVAPHTSNWDFIIGKSFYTSIGKKVSFLMKKEWFFFPIGSIFKAMGGIPVDRKKNKSLTEQMIQMFKEKDILQLAIAPEGTRKKVSKWKTGFYYIALGAKIPICLAYIDFEKKEIGVKENFYPTGNEAADFQYIKDYYKNFKGKNAHNFGI